MAKFKGKLNRKGVDTVFTIYYGCVGCIKGAYKPGYIIWKKNNTMAIKKIDNHNRQDIVIRATDLFSFYTNHASLIKEGKKEIEDSISYSAFHYSFRRLNYLLKGLRC